MFKTKTMSSKSEVVIIFKDDIPVEFNSANDLEKALRSYHGDDCAVYVQKLELLSCGEMGFELDSDRHTNLLWQQDLLKRYLQEKYSDKINYLTTSVWTTSDDNSLHFEVGDGIEFNEI